MRHVAFALVLLVGCTQETVVQMQGASDAGSGAGGGDTTGGGGIPEDAKAPSGGIPDVENVVCKENAKPDTGKGYPFTGLTVTPETPKSSGKTYEFTCTRCPGGKAEIQDGMYKYFEKDDPAKPDPAEYAETLELSGNYFVNRIEGIDSATGEFVKAVAKGYYFCNDPSELQGMKSADFYDTVFVYLEVQPEGAFGIQPGDADPCFLGVEVSAGSNAIGIACNLFWDPAGSDQAENEYCKVGAEFNGKPCEDPFAGE